MQSTQPLFSSMNQLYVRRNRQIRQVLLRTIAFVSTRLSIPQGRWSGQLIPHSLPSCSRKDDGPGEHRESSAQFAPLSVQYTIRTLQRDERAEAAVPNITGTGKRLNNALRNTVPSSILVVLLPNRTFGLTRRHRSYI